MNSNFLSRALCFHGQPMQKIWEDERGTGDLQNCGLPAEINYSIYQERQKHFTFQDRAKRLKLHQFFAKKATDLYDNELTPDPSKANNNENAEKAKSYAAVLPPYEVFVNKHKDKVRRWRCILDAIKPGDLIYVAITKAPKPGSAIKVQPLCTAPPLVRHLDDIPTKAFLQQVSTAKLPLDEHGKPRCFAVNDHVYCEVLEISVDADRLLLGIENVFPKNGNVRLGLVNAHNLPSYYKKSIKRVSDNYEENLLKSSEAQNPNYDVLFEMNGLDVDDNFSLMSSLKYGFQKKDYAKELRQAQAYKWAFRSVAEGIDYFKQGKQLEAFQCLNKALIIDPRNEEGLVARGALYANKGSFLKAIEDFDSAMKIKPEHANARKYMGETLVALGHSYKEDNRLEEAIKAYTDCLNLIPNHEQARLSLEAIQKSRNSGQIFDNILNIPGMSRPVKHDSTEDESSTDSDSESSVECAAPSKETSVSPFSKRSSMDMNTCTKQQYKQPFYMAAQSTLPPNTMLRNDLNDFKLDDDDTESLVRKLLLKTSKYTKEKNKKSKKKKSKKTKKEHRKERNLEMQKEQLSVEPSTSFFNNVRMNSNYQSAAALNRREKSETPPPKAPSMRLPESYTFSNTTPYGNSATIPKQQEPTPAKFSFQIKKAVKIDKFGLVRIATPTDNSLETTRRTPSRSRSRSRSRYNSRTRSYYSRSPSSGRRYRRRERSRSRSSSYDRYRRRSRSRSRTRSRSRSRSRHRSVRGREYGRRRTPSPFVPRKTPLRGRRSGSRSRSRSREQSDYRSKEREQRFGNRTWVRNAAQVPHKLSSPSPISKRWEHDKYNDNQDDGPSIEEIDEIINKAQKERKQEIINRDKDILKKRN
ncbi:tetratricopeptide repeat protein 14 homolog [Teleopsis dalmanni]|uniref:tetratricopeptide repeat protein 14 homolog n=2 Tax=Teleopsis dalmanni TaxID=139649 RepID=UPI0018CFE523|nr:tetratricopeptide repeat protein 14 homolog [Teleopsis dalmanni]